MFLTCQQCETIFWVDADLIPKDGQSVRCSICHHIWIASPLSQSVSQPVGQSADGEVTGSPLQPVAALSVAPDWLKHLWKQCLVAVLAASIASGIIMSRSTITAYLPFLINGFDSIGLPIRPTVAQLQLVGLNVSYVGDTVRLSGGLRNTSMWRTHAADLLVMVRRPDGTIMEETVIRPDDNIIESHTETEFFVQLSVEVGSEAHVTVTPLANRIYR